MRISPLAFSVFFSIARTGQALVASAPRFGDNLFRAPVQDQVLDKKINLRIRSAQKSDVQEITDILSNALVLPDGEEKVGFNWKLKMKLLATKAGVESLLLSRINAFDAGKRLSEQCSLEELSEADQMRFIWSDDGFRNKMEKAARLSTEPHIWSGHNFAYAPESACWLQHKLMTAEDLESGEIVGFCEIAMLSQPSDDDNENCSLEASPTILNLVTSPRFRRRGVGSRLMKAAARFVQRQWSCDELTLYVDKSNDAAVAMYENLGFEGKSEAESGSRSQSYMTLQLSSTAEMGISFP